MVTFDTVREIALTLPEVEEALWWGTPGFKVGRLKSKKKGLGRLLENGALMVHIDISDKEFLIASRPETYFQTPHYAGYPAVLVRLEHIGRDELSELLAASWRFVAPPKLVANAGGPASDDARSRHGSKAP